MSLYLTEWSACGFGSQCVKWSISQWPKSKSSASECESPQINLRKDFLLPFSTFSVQDRYILKYGQGVMQGQDSMSERSVSECK